MRKEKILIVEDDPDIYRRLTGIFNEKGMQVITARHGGVICSYEAAEEALEEDIPDIALLDICLSGEKDGIELGIRLKRQYGIPVLYLSNYPDDRNIQRIAAAGQFDFVVKKALLEGDEQLWASFELARARIMQIPQHVVPSPQEGKIMKCTKKINLETGETIEWHTNGLKRLFNWDNITLITIDKRGGKNQVLIQEDNSKYGYILNDSLAKVEQILPHRFIRINDHEILNISKIAAVTRGKVYTADPDDCAEGKRSRVPSGANGKDLPGDVFFLGDAKFRKALRERMELLNMV